jgi:hypothetical protein
MGDLTDDSGAVLQLLSAPGTAVFLDFDGTLVDLAATPDGVRLEPGVVEALALLAERHGGALAVISGRPVAQIDAMLAPLTCRWPACMAWSGAVPTAACPWRPRWTCRPCWRARRRWPRFTPACWWNRNGAPWPCNTGWRPIWNSYACRK